MEIVWKIEVKSAKIVKSLEFFLSKLFVLVKSYSILHARLQRTMKKSFVPASVYMIVTYTIKRVLPIIFHRLFIESSNFR